MISKWRDLFRDRSGKGIVKFAVGSCLLATAFVSSSPVFEANPYLGKTVGELRKHLPDTLDTITRALGGG